MRTRVLLALAALALASTLPGCGEDMPGTGEPVAGTSAKWRSLRSSSVGRTEVAAARIGRAVYVVGGFAEPDGATSPIVERYIPASTAGCA